MGRAALSSTRYKPPRREIVVEDKDEWTSQIRQIYEMDKARREAQQSSEVAPDPQIIASQLLQECRAHELMRQLQKALLDGRGKLQFYEKVGGYEQAVALMWAGPISDASQPADIQDVDAAIIVGANTEGLFVNDSRLPEHSPEALKQRLLELARGLVGGT
jgi:hypothetical protein